MKPPGITGMGRCGMNEPTRFYKFCVNVAVLSFYIIALGGLLLFLRCMGVI